MRIIVSGLIGSVPLPGLTFHYLQYVLGLRRLGHQVHYLEDTGNAYYLVEEDSETWDPSTSVRYLARTMEDFGLSDSWTFIDDTGRSYGTAGARLAEAIGHAELILNVSGTCVMREAYMHIPIRAYLDTDPGFIQFRAAAGAEKDLEHLLRHNQFLTFGHNIGEDTCAIPTVDLPWKSTHQPIVHDLWKSLSGNPGNEGFRTILKWKSYDPVSAGGLSYGLKDAELGRFLDLPACTEARLELAVQGNGPQARFEASGWQWRPAAPVNRSLATYADFLSGSTGEWSVAKEAYVRSRSGWFSDRSAAFLSLGRPVVLQSTGYESWLPTGMGVMSFTDLESAAVALDAVIEDYARHASAARNLGREIFDSDKVLNVMLSDLV